MSIPKVFRISHMNNSLPCLFKHLPEISMLSEERERSTYIYDDRILMFS